MFIEDDLIQYCVDKNMLEPESYEICLQKLMNEVRKIIAGFKDKLPAKSKRYNWPHVLWPIPVQHVAFETFALRENIARSLINLTAMQYNMSALKLKQIWDDQDMDLYLPDVERFTSTGKLKLWQALDRTIKFCERTIFSNGNTDQLHGDKERNGKQESTVRQPFFRREWHRNENRDNDRRDRYHWTNSDNDRRRRLPEPPSRRY